MKAKFLKGDKVFAKVRGYPYWPAKIVGPQDETAVKIKYDIVFYGTGEKAVVKAEDVQPFLDKRHELGRPKKSKSFNDAMAQIEREMNLSFSGESEEVRVEELTTPVKPAVQPRRKSSVGRPPKQSVDPSTSPSAATTSSETKSVKTRKRRSRVDSEAETVSEPLPKVNKIAKNIRVSRLSQESPVKKPKSPSRRKIIEKVDDVCKFVFDGVTVTLALDTYRPSLNCPKSMLDWNRLLTNKVTDLKEEVLEGRMSIDEAQQEIDEFTRVKTKEKKREYDENDREFKTLKTEGKLLQLDVKIKTALTLAQANPEDALKSLDELIVLPVSPLMLKKHPEIVDTFKKISRYIGNLGAWEMPDTDKESFMIQAEIVRNKAQQVLEKFKYLFNISEEDSFTRVFSRELRDFNRATQKLSQEEFFSLVKEPDLGPD